MREGSWGNEGGELEEMREGSWGKWGVGGWGRGLTLCWENGSGFACQL